MPMTAAGRKRRNLRGVLEFWARSAPEFGFEPVLHDAALRRKGSYAMIGETVKRAKNEPQSETRGGKD